MIVKRKKIFRGGSRNNPYVTDNEITYTSTVQPRSLAANLISLREVLAKEWMEDLALIESENVELLRHHNEVVRTREDRSLSLLHPRHENCDQHSSLRIASYDLLEKFVTELAARRVAADLARSSASDRLAGRWLGEQLAGAAGAGFRGDHGPEVGRRFMLHLLASVPVIVTAAGGGDGASLVDPHEVAQRVMAERERVAEQLIAALAETPAVHMRWTLSLLQAGMARPAAVRPGPPPASEHHHGGGGGAQR